MLIIAIPKSASTSLLLTLKKYHSIDAAQSFFKDYPPPSNSKFIHQLHSDIRTLTAEESINFEASDHFYKQHIFPSEENLKLFKNTKKVILLRDPKEVLMAYRRGAKKGVHNLIPGFDMSWNEEKWITKAQEVGLWDDLNVFHERWTNASSDDNTLMVDYQDYVTNPNLVLNQIEAFFGLPITEIKVETVKARYSRETSSDKGQKSWMAKIKKRIYSVYKKLKNK